MHSVRGIPEGRHPIRVIACAALLVVILAGSSSADVACIAPAKPELPPAGASPREMDRASKDVDAYVKAMASYRECCLKLVTDADNDLNAVVAGWNFAVKNYRKTRDKREAAAGDGR